MMINYQSYITQSRKWK